MACRPRYLNSAMAADDRSQVMAGLREGDIDFYMSPRSASPARAAADDLAAARPARSASSRSTKPTASATGATTSGRSIASSAHCAPRCRSGLPRLHRHRHGAGAPGHRLAAGPARGGRAGRLVRSAEPAVPRAAARFVEDADAAGAVAAPGRSRHHLLPDAPRSGRPRRVAEARKASARRRITPGSRTTAAPQPGCVPQRVGGHRRRDRRVRDGHRSIRRPIRVHAGAPQSLEHYQQEAGRAGRDGLEAECVLIVSAGRLPAMARDPRQERRADRGAPGAAARHRALCRQRRLPSPAAGQLLRRASKGDCGACDYCLGELEAVGGSGHARAQDPVGGGAGRATFRGRPRHQRAPRQRQRAGRSADTTRCRCSGC